MTPLTPTTGARPDAYGEMAFALSQRGTIWHCQRERAEVLGVLKGFGQFVDLTAPRNLPTPGRIVRQRL